MTGKIRVFRWLAKTSTRLILAVLVLLIGFGVVASAYIKIFSQDIIMQRKNELQHIVSLASNSLEPIVKQKRSGEITLGEARLLATDIINGFRYSDGDGPNYVLLVSYDGYTLVKPTAPDAVGTYQMQKQDNKGTFIIRKMIEKAQAGGGYVAYYDERQSGDRSQKKLTYVKGMPDIECFVATGLYMGDIDQSIYKLQYTLSIIGVIILIGIIALQYYFLQPLLACFSELSAAFRSMKNNPNFVPEIQLKPVAKRAEPDILIANFIAMVDQLRQHRIAIHKLAYSDSLTNLPNRISMNEQLQVELDKAADGHAFGAIMFLDLNDFKRVNDLFGHSRGDELLVHTAHRIEQVLANRGIIFRQGGDEFIILASGMTKQEAEKMAQDIVQEAKCPYVYQDETFYVSGSIGIALYPQDGNDLDGLLRNVDTAMYNAKDSKVPGYAFFMPAMHELALKKAKMENMLSKALEREEFVVYYQPQIDINSSRVSCIEALLRWFKPGVGIIGPAEFIPAAEESRLILPIGAWVLKEACLLCKKLQSEGYTDMCVAVNISPKQVEQADFVDIVKQTLQQTKLCPEFLELEITESLFMNSVNDCLSKFNELRSIGVRLALDDFGTGYSSLTRLRKLPIDVLKIDKEFLNERSCEGAAIIQTIIKLSHFLGIEVTAEGVEDEGQVEFLSDATCDRMQGYYYCRAVDSDTLREYLKLKNVND